MNSSVMKILINFCVCRVFFLKENACMLLFFFEGGGSG